MGRLFKRDHTRSKVQHNNWTSLHQLNYQDWQNYRSVVQFTKLRLNVQLIQVPFSFV